MKKQIYILVAEDGSCTKIGYSQFPWLRCESISMIEKKKYYLIYESLNLSKEEAKKVEAQIIDYFKEDCIKGREWLSTHPLKVIQYVVSILGVTQEKDNPLIHPSAYKYNVWVAKSKDYYKTKEFKPNIRVTNSYVAYIRLLHNSKFVYVGFANIGDAIKFSKHNKHKIEASENITKLLYGIEYKEWVNKQMASYYEGKAEWRLI